ncbi:MAG TPA: hypothetical protein VHM88_06135, partial [Candidatus Acidoferrales bacterium]|nr:hypothetical protein [Candidatus Acidoferrales bacterium]
GAPRGLPSLHFTVTRAGGFSSLSQLLVLSSGVAPDGQMYFAGHIASQNGPVYAAANSITP